MPRVRHPSPAPPRRPSPSTSSPRASSLSSSPELVDEQAEADTKRVHGSPSSNPTSTLLNHTIPPFYACYLLRSFAARRGRGAGCTYIGSTPDPPRRWRQHMGLVKGGAYKTRLGRPWEMEALVHGFPTKLQALQFEWAWQNPHQSRLLRSATATGAPTDKAKPTAQFPRGPLSNRPLSKVQVLQFMLTTPPWMSFPLRVTLLSHSAQEWWDTARRLGPVIRTEAGARKWKKERRITSIEVEDAWGPIRGRRLDQVKVEVRPQGVDGARLVRSGEANEGEQVERIRVDDGDFFDAHWSKWSTLSDDAETSAVEARCEICREPVDTSDHLSFHLCTASAPAALAPCLAVFHPLCLSAYLLAPSTAASGDPQASAPSRSDFDPPRMPLPQTTAAPPAVRAAPLLPTRGACPACGGEFHWVDLVRGSYRRKEEAEGRRKKRTRQRRLGAKAGGDPTSGRAEASNSVRKNGKERGVAEGGLGEDEEEDALEAFYFSGSGSDDPSDGESVDLGMVAGESDDEQGEDADLERSFARLDAAAQGSHIDEGLSEGEEIRSPWENDDLPLPAPSSKASRKLRRDRAHPSSPAPLSSSAVLPPIRRGRPPKTTLDALETPAEDAATLRNDRSPWDDDAPVSLSLAPRTPKRIPRAASPPASRPEPDPLAPVRRPRGRPRKNGPNPLTTVFASTKSATSASDAARRKSGKKLGEAPPSTLVLGSDAPSVTMASTRTGEPARNPRTVYIELSD